MLGKGLDRGLRILAWIADLPGLGVDRGLRLLCDVTCVTPITGRGFARPGATTINGAILRDATSDNVANYREVVETGLGKPLVPRVRGVRPMN